MFELSSPKLLFMLHFQERPSFFFFLKKPLAFTPERY